jgi:integrase
MARGMIKTTTLKNGSKRYLTVIRLNGRQIWKTFDKRSDAESYLDRNCQEVREGTYRPLKRATFAQYVEKWKSAELIPQKLKPATLNGYGSNIARHLLPAFGTRQMTLIDSEDITNFESDLLNDGQSPKSTRNILQLLSRIFGDARRAGYLRISPMVDLKFVKLQKSQKRALNVEEAAELLKRCDGDGMLRLVVLLGLLAGLRRNEIFALSWEDIDAAGNVIHVRQNLFWRHGRYQGQREDGEPAWVLLAPKTPESVRDIDLSPALKRELQAYYLKSPHKKGLIFQTTAGGPIDPHNFYDRQFKASVHIENEEERKQKMDLNWMNLHTLRHTFGSVKLEHSENLIYVSKQLGHAKPSITADVYAHLLKERRPEAAQRTDEFLFGKPKKDDAAGSC